MLEPDEIIEIEFDFVDKHTEDMCDVCGKEVGKENLKKFPFIYKDCNDKSHEDLGDGYRQYYGCKKCYEEKLERGE